MYGMGKMKALAILNYVVVLAVFLVLAPQPAHALDRDEAARLNQQALELAKKRTNMLKPKKLLGER